MNKPETIGRYNFSLSFFSQAILSILSFGLVAFGQPAWLPWTGLITGAFGFALFWRVLLVYPFRSQRFYLASLWFFAVQLVQLSWLVSHPYWYIYGVYFFLALSMGIQFGLIALFIIPEKFISTNFIRTLFGFLPLAALWTLVEWSRLFILSGFSWNPIGLTITSSVYGLQAASLFGIYGLTFWVILVNLLALKAWIQRSSLFISVWAFAVILPYLYGFSHLAFHEKNMQATTPSYFNALLVQTAFSPEESQNYSDKKSFIHHIMSEWGQILKVTKKHKKEKIHLIVLPEFVVPFGTYSDIYPLFEVNKIFYEILGAESLSALPGLEHPFVSLQNTSKGPQLFVNNAYWTQAIANYFDADVIIGLEDAEDISPDIREYYSSAIFIHPRKIGLNHPFFAQRYSKRVLVPMGEYIPFEACKKLAEKYGVFASFTCGKEAVVMNSEGINFSPSICYEETFGNIMREGRLKGADLFVNLTSDVWFPNSKLPQLHLDHARLRTVENGIPLIRACNTGVTAAIDSLGRNIGILGGNHPESVEWISNSLFVKVPIYSYYTLYSKFGNSLIISLSFLFLLGFNKKFKCS